MPDLHAILLAAGGSSRLGRAKQLLRLEGESLVYRASKQLLALTPKVTVVTGASAEQVGDELQDLELRLVQNARWRVGIGPSIGLAVRDLPENTRAVLVMLCDQYRLTGAQLRRLLDGWAQDPAKIVASKWSGSFGPPVIFPQRFFRQLERLQGDMGARQLLVKHRTSVHYVPIPEAAYDVDDPADLARFEAFRKSLEANHDQRSSK